MTATTLACPRCGSTRLRSNETAQIGYAVRMLRNEADQIYPEYGDEQCEVFDEGTTFEDSIDCRDCGAIDLTAAELVSVTAGTPGRCKAHPAFEADYCPGCGTSTVIPSS